MKKNNLGNSDLEFSQVGLGTWALGGDWSFGWGEQSEKDSLGAILEAFEHGVNWIDTAPIYGLGKAEKIIAKAIKQHGKDILISTKCGILDSSKFDLSAKSIEKELDSSLERLGVEVIDLYQIHYPEPWAQLDEGYETLIKLQEKGKIKHFGVSNFSNEQIKQVSKYKTPLSLQSSFNLLNHKQESIEFCKENNISFLAYSPLYSGLLTSRFSKEWSGSLSRNDWRLGKKSKEKMKFIYEPFLSHFLELHLLLVQMAKDHGRTISELAIAWVLSKKFVTSCILGARNKKQVLSTIKGADWKLDDDILQDINSLLAKYRESLLL